MPWSSFVAYSTWNKYFVFHPNKIYLTLHYLLPPPHDNPSPLKPAPGFRAPLDAEIFSEVVPSDVFLASMTWNVNVKSNRAGTSPVLGDKRHQFTQLLRKLDCCPFSKFLLKGMNGLMALFVRPFLFFHAAGAFCYGDAMLCTGEGRPRVPYRTSTRRICQHGHAGGCLLWAVQVPRMC